MKNSNTECDRHSHRHHSIRVNTEKLDALLQLIGELAVSEASLTKDLERGGRAHSADRFAESLRQIAKITQELQDVITSIRMAPASELYGTMSRLVPDLASKAGKKVELQIIGGDLEMDRTLIAAVTNPLIHLIRNCIDHGIEMPWEREIVGKSTIARIILEARSDTENISITVSDDGRGLDRQRILQKARAKHLIQGDGYDMEDEDVWKLIFQPGFSTAEKITEFSGRGIGMDIVRRDMEKINGKINIQSEEGEGTIITLIIPKN
jgi:two-component system chemotaxis sensor kinase CheA